jgi:ubiquinone/menaquinone biosynthesis C-methylase UbiE
VDDISDIAAFYNSQVEQEGARLVRHQLEHDLTWRYLKRYLPTQGSILEVGAATGGYTLDLARLGYTVTAVDMSSALLEVCRRRLAEAGLAQQARLVQADARDLGALPGRDFDAALLMGPLYHLVELADRQQALKEIYARLKPGGVIFTAFISRYGIMGDLMQRMPDWIEDRAEVRAILDTGQDPDHWPRGGFRGYFARVDEIAPLHESLGFSTMTLAGVEPAIAADDASYNQLQGSRRALWLDLLEEISAEPSIIGASRHLLYIGKKPAFS